MPRPNNVFINFHSLTKQITLGQSTRTATYTDEQNLRHCNCVQSHVRPGGGGVTTPCIYVLEVGWLPANL